MRSRDRLQGPRESERESFIDKVGKRESVRAFLPCPSPVEPDVRTMLPLLLVAHGLCLNVRPRPSLRAATAARTLGLRHGGGPALCAPPPTPQVQGGPLREAAEGTMIDGLEVLDVEIGGEAPADFAALGMLRARVAANLAAANITAPTALQSACFGSLATGRDAIVQAHTGSGKTIAFLLPIIEQLNPASKEPQALVISPSRELAFQTARVADLVRVRVRDRIRVRVRVTVTVTVTVTVSRQEWLTLTLTLT